MSENKHDAPPVMVQATAVPVTMQTTMPVNAVYQTVGMVGAPTLVMMSNQGFYTRLPRRVICAFCGADVVTKTTAEVGLGTHLFCMGLCIVGCVPCCVLPYCADEAKDIVHICPNCNQSVGIKTVI